MRVVIIEGASEETIRALLLNQGMQVAMIRSAAPAAHVIERPAEAIPELHDEEKKQLSEHAESAMNDRATPIYDAANAMTTQYGSMRKTIAAYYRDNPGQTVHDVAIAIAPSFVEKYGNARASYLALRNNIDVCQGSGLLKKMSGYGQNKILALPIQE